MFKKSIVSAAVLAAATGLASAQEVKIGVVLPYTGIGAEFGQQVQRGMEQYLKLNADKVKPYKITLIKRDSKNPGGADAKVAVQELLTQDKVNALAGFLYSPDAIASATIVAAGKKLAVIMNAGTAHITNMAPQYVRTAFSMWHSGYAMGEAAAKQLGAKTAVVGYTDFPPGKDSLAAFKNGFEKFGDVMRFALPAAALGISAAKRDEDGALMLAASAVPTFALTYGLKAAVHEERPDGSGDDSFPSGHTASAFWGASYLHYRYGWKYGMPAYVLAALVGGSRIEADKHYFHDGRPGARGGAAGLRAAHS